MLDQKIKKLLTDINEFEINTSKDLEIFRLKYVIRASLVSSTTEEYNKLSKEEKEANTDLSKKVKELLDLVTRKYDNGVDRLCNPFA